MELKRKVVMHWEIERVKQLEPLLGLVKAKASVHN